MVLNAANEIAVEAFLERKLGFTAISQVIEKTMNEHERECVSTLEVVRRVDRWSRARARELARELELTSVFSGSADNHEDTKGAKNANN